MLSSTMKKFFPSGFTPILAFIVLFLVHHQCQAARNQNFRLYFVSIDNCLPAWGDIDFSYIYLNLLRQVVGDKPEDYLVHSYQCGFVARLTPDEAAKLKGVGGVAGVHPKTPVVVDKHSEAPVANW